MAQIARHSHRKHSLPRRWLVLSAWEPELTELRRLLQGKTESRTITAACAGVGLVEAAVGATLAIASEQPDAVLFVGTAGQYKNRLPSLALDDVVVARELRLWSAEVNAGHAYFPAPLPDVLRPAAGMLALAKSLGLPLATVACPLGISVRPGPSRRAPEECFEADGKASFPSPQRGRGEGVRVCLLPSPCPLPEGEGGSALWGSPGSSAPRLTISHLASKIRSQRLPPAAAPDVENLEAFAVGRAATRLGLPFLAILGISNLVGPSAHAQWKKHAKPAAAAACQAAYALATGSRRPFDRTTRGQ